MKVSFLFLALLWLCPKALWAQCSYTPVSHSGGTLPCNTNNYPFIDYFRIGAINNANSGCGALNSGTYTDYPSATFTTGLARGTTETVYIDVFNGGVLNNDLYMGLYIDFDQNGNLGDPGEFFDLGYVYENDFSPKQVLINIPVSATLGNTRMRLRASSSGPLTISDACTVLSFGETEDYTIGISEVTMSFSYSAVFAQAPSTLTLGGSNEVALGFVIFTQGTLSPMALNSITLDNSGSSSASDISLISITYSGNNNSPASATSFGTPINSMVSNNIQFNGSQTLLSGANYFWVVYSINNGATVDHVISNTIPTYTLNSIAQPPTINQTITETIDLCTPTYTIDCGTQPDYITQFNIGSMVSGPTSCSSNYVRYSSGSITTDLEQGAVYNAQVTTTANMNVMVFADFNRNNSFSDLGEYFSGSAIGGVPLTIPVSVPSGATLGEVRLRVIATSTVAASNLSCGALSSGETEDYSVFIVPSSPMTLGIVGLNHPNTSPVLPSSTDNVILRISIPTSGTTSPLALTSLNLGTSGTTSLSDVSNLKVWYTGNDSQFNSPVLFASLPALASSYQVTGNQVLGTGDNYFWVTYSLAPSAANGNKLDATCSNAIIQAQTVNFSPSNPNGDRIVAARVDWVDGTTTAVCHALFYDDGGPSASYAANPTTDRVFKLSAPTATDRLTISFNSLSLASGNIPVPYQHMLYLYDGADTIMATTTRYDVSGLSGTFTSSGQFLTFVLVTGFSDQSAGWDAEVHCEYNCSLDNITVTENTATPTCEFGMTTIKPIIGGPGAGVYPITYIIQASNSSSDLPLIHDTLYVSSASDPDTLFYAYGGSNASLTAINGNGCANVPLNFTAQDAPGSGISVAPNNSDATCAVSQDGIIRLNVTELPGHIYTYSWNDFPAVVTADSVVGVNPGNYIVTVTDQTLGTCKTVGINVDASEVSIGGQPRKPLGATVLTYDASDTPYNIDPAGTTYSNYIWKLSPSGVGFFSTTNDTVVIDWSALYAGEVYLSVAGYIGSPLCPTPFSDSLMIVIEADGAPLDAREGFSPNGDGKNDFFEFHVLPTGSANVFVVYDRQGNELYKEENYKNDWYGLDADGDKLPDGTYYFYFKQEKPKSKVLKGYFELRR